MYRFNKYLSDYCWKVSDLSLKYFMNNHSAEKDIVRIVGTFLGIIGMNGLTQPPLYLVQCPG